MIQLKSLNQRMALYISLPVSILLVGMGFAGFLYARNSLLQQWGEATTLKLQRAAHHVDMRLNAPKELLKVFHRAAGSRDAHYIQMAIIEQLKEIDSVARVNFIWEDGNAEGETRIGMMDRQFNRTPLHGLLMGGAMMSFHHAGPLLVTPPVYDSRTENETISLISKIQSKDGRHTGKLEVVLLEPERKAIEARPTENMEAYQAYLRGLSFSAAGWEPGGHTNEGGRLGCDHIGLL